MSVIITEENQTKVVLNQDRVNKVKNLLGAKTESETIEIALERVIEEFEQQQPALVSTDLSDGFFEDLLSERTNLSDAESIQAVINERKESIF
jgi:hypothetical protein